MFLLAGSAGLSGDIRAGVCTRSVCRAAFIQAISQSCADCKYVLNKKWIAKRHPQIKSKSELVLKTKTDPEIKQDHVDCLEKYGKAKMQANINIQ